MSGDLPAADGVGVPRRSLPAFSSAAYPTLKRKCRSEASHGKLGGCDGADATVLCARAEFHTRLFITRK